MINSFVCINTFYFAYDFLFFWTNYKRHFHNHTYSIYAKLNGEKANGLATKNNFHFRSDKSISNFKCLVFVLFFAVRFFKLYVIVMSIIIDHFRAFSLHKRYQYCSDIDMQAFVYNSHKYM